MMIPVEVQKPNRPDSARRVGVADDGQPVDEVARSVGVPDRCLVVGSVIGQGERRRWSLVAYVEFVERTMSRGELAGTLTGALRSGCWFRRRAWRSLGADTHTAHQLVRGRELWARTIGATPGTSSAEHRTDRGFSLEEVLADDWELVRL